MTALPVSISMANPFDRGLVEVSDQGHHSRCAFGNKWKVAAAESEDPAWVHAATVRGQGAMFMPERGIVRFRYGDQRFEQDLTPADIAWLDRFDTTRNVRSRTITLDPDTARYVGPVGTNRKSRAGEVREDNKNRGRKARCNGHVAGNSGRAKRMQVLVEQRIGADVTSDASA